MGIVAFGVLLAFLIRDLTLTSRVCRGDTLGQVLCLENIRQAKARLTWEVSGLFIVGTILGAGIVAWWRRRS